MTRGSPHGEVDGEPREVRLDRIIGREVLAGNNQTIGRLEECRATTTAQGLSVLEYVIGVAGLFERMGVGIKLLFGRAAGGYIATWEQIDLSEPESPRLTCDIGELRKL